MFKNILKVIVLTISSFALFSCASSNEALNETTPALSNKIAESSQSARSDPAEPSAKAINADRMMAYSISLKLSVKKPDETRKNLIEQVKNSNGFIVKETENYITTRIPTKNMENFMNNARTLGKIENETKTGTDITEQYRDNVIRLESLKSVRNRYLALLENANAVKDILSIEKELERVNTEIEILEGRIKYAELSVAYSNITIKFEEKTMLGPLGWIFYGLYLGIEWLFVWN
jgi:hypothetical protein